MDCRLVGTVPEEAGGLPAARRARLVESDGPSLLAGPA
jgi:hypothetical protein